MGALKARAAVLLCAGMFAVSGPQTSWADASTSGETVLSGWSGDAPVPLALVIDDASRTTAVFTTHEDSGQSLWVADSTTGSEWGAPRRVAAGITTASADFAENKSGAAVLAWDAPDGDQAGLYVARRAAGASSWSSPTVVVDDDSSSAHHPSVGIDGSGAITVGYVHQTDGELAAYTRRYVQDAWEAPLQHSTDPAKQIKLAVADNGNVTVAWSEVSNWSTIETAPSTVNLLTRKFAATTSTWDSPYRNEDDIADDGILDVVVNDEGAAAVAFYSMMTFDDSRQIIWADVTRSMDAREWEDCPKTCGHGWTGNQVGDLPQAAVSVGDDYLAATFVAGLDKWDGGGAELYSAADNGSNYHGAVRLAHGDVSDPQIARLGQRAAVTWLTHTDAGEVISVQGEWFGVSTDAKPDPQQTVIGTTTARPATAVSPAMDTEVLWTDAATSELRLSTLGSTTVITPEDAYTHGDQVPVRWSAPLNEGTSTARFDVRVRQATYRHGFAASRTWKSRTTATSSHYLSAAGRTSCFSTRVRGEGGHAGRWSKERCTAVPIDEQGLKARGWSERRSSHFFDGHLDRSTKSGAALSLSSVRATSIAVLVSRRPGGGDLRVTLGGQTVGTISTAGRRADKVVIPVATFGSVRKGTLRLVTTSKKPVLVDGVFTSAQ